jgi:hypothetical protein
MKRLNKKQKEELDGMVNNAMFEVGCGQAVSVLETAHQVKLNRKFLKLIGLKDPYHPIKMKAHRGKGFRNTQGFELIRKVVRESMVRMYGKLERVR